MLINDGNNRFKLPQIKPENQFVKDILPIEGKTVTGSKTLQFNALMKQWDQGSITFEELQQKLTDMGINYQGGLGFITFQYEGKNYNIISPTLTPIEINPDDKPIALPKDPIKIEVPPEDKTQEPKPDYAQLASTIFSQVSQEIVNKLLDAGIQGSSLGNYMPQIQKAGIEFANKYNGNNLEKDLKDFLFRKADEIIADKAPKTDKTQENPEVEDSTDVSETDKTQGSLPVYATMEEAEAAINKIFHDLYYGDHWAKFKDEDSFETCSYTFIVDGKTYTAEVEAGQQTANTGWRNDLDKYIYAASFFKNDNSVDYTIYENSTGGTSYAGNDLAWKSHNEEIQHFKETGFLKNDRADIESLINTLDAEGAFESFPTSLTFISQRGSEEKYCKTLPDGTVLYPEAKVNIREIITDDGIRILQIENHVTPELTGYYYDDAGNKYDSNLNLISSANNNNPEVDETPAEPTVPETPEVDETPAEPVVPETPEVDETPDIEETPETKTDYTELVDDIFNQIDSILYDQMSTAAGIPYQKCGDIMPKLHDKAVEFAKNYKGDKFADDLKDFLMNEVNKEINIYFAEETFNQIDSDIYKKLDEAGVPLELRGNFMQEFHQLAMNFAINYNGDNLKADLKDFIYDKVNEKLNQKEEAPVETAPAVPEEPETPEVDETPAEPVVPETPEVDETPETKPDYTQLAGSIFGPMAPGIAKNMLEAGISQDVVNTLMPQLFDMAVDFTTNYTGENLANDLREFISNKANELIKAEAPKPDYTRLANTIFSQVSQEIVKKLLDAGIQGSSLGNYMPKIHDAGIEFANNYTGNNLEEDLKDFLFNKADELIAAETQETKPDYTQIASSMFSQYAKEISSKLVNAGIPVQSLGRLMPGIRDAAIEFVNNYTGNNIVEDLKAFLFDRVDEIIEAEGQKTDYKKLANSLYGSMVTGIARKLSDAGISQDRVNVLMPEIYALALEFPDNYTGTNFEADFKSYVTNKVNEIIEAETKENDEVPEEPAKPVVPPSIKDPIFQGPIIDIKPPEIGINPPETPKPPLIPNPGFKIPEWQLRQYTDFNDKLM